MNDDAPEPVEDAQPARIKKGRPWLGFLVLGVLVIVVLVARPYLDRHELAQWGLQQEQQLQQWLQLYPVASWLTAFGIYVLVAGLALPIAVFVSLFYGWWPWCWLALPRQLVPRFHFCSVARCWVTYYSVVTRHNWRA